MKAYSKSAKRRNHGKRAMFAREAAREAEMQTIERDDPLATVRAARARQTGRPESEVLAPIFGDDAGRAIDKGARNKEEAQRMWDAFDALDKAHRAAVFHTTGKPMFPAVSRMEYMPERFEVRADFHPDLRTEDERHMAAMNKWRHWRHILGFLSRREHMSIVGALWQTDQLHLAGALTVHGLTFVASMRELCDIIDTVEGRR
jgi:hypothetical protein